MTKWKSTVCKLHLGASKEKFVSNEVEKIRVRFLRSAIWQIKFTNLRTKVQRREQDVDQTKPEKSRCCCITVLESVVQPETLRGDMSDHQVLAI